MNKLFFDVEVTKLPKSNPWQVGSYLCSIGLALNDDPVEVFIFTHEKEVVKSEKELLKQVQSLFDSADIVVAHNLKFDLNWIKSVGIKLKNQQFWCTMLADYLLNGQKVQAKGFLTLNETAARYGAGQKEDGMKEYWDAGFETDQIPLDVHVPYLKQDVELTRLIYNKQRPKIEKNKLFPLANVCFEVSDILSDMELEGIGFNKEQAEKYHDEYKEQVDKIDLQLRELAGVDFNPGSTQQLSAVLYGGTLKEEGTEMYSITLKSGQVKSKSRKIVKEIPITGFGFEPVEGTECKKEGQFSTDKDTIKLLSAKTKLQKEALTLLLERATSSAIVKTFLAKSEDGGLLNKIGKDGKIHPTFNQCVTVTGRLSSKNPNGQNLPRKGTSPVKKCFYGTNGAIVNIDFSQIEFRMAGELSRDKTIIKEVHATQRGEIDVHSDNAIQVLGADPNDRDSKEFKAARQTGKIVTFRMVYGGSAQGFFKDASMPRYSLSKWKKIVENFSTKYAGLIKWQQHNIGKVYEQGYLRNPSGRILRFPRRLKRGVLMYEEPSICNYPVQSASADVIFVTMIQLRKKFRELNLRSKLILQVHDSIVIDAFPEEVNTIVEESMKLFRAAPDCCKELWGWEFSLPLDADAEVGETYGDTKKYERI